MTANFEGDYRGIGEMLCSEEMQAEMHRRADKIAVAAEADAPVGPASDPHRGRYKASFTVGSGVQEGKTRRAYGRVTNDAPEAIYVEYGNKNTDAHHTLGRALDAAKD
jgi:hypothetical protein